MSKRDWLIETMLSEDALESRRACEYFGNGYRFLTILPSLYPITGDAYDTLKDYYSDMADAAETLNKTIEAYGKKISADYVPVIPKSEDTPSKITHTAVIERLDKDYHVACKCNRHFGSNRIVFDKTAKGAVTPEEYKQISGAYESVVTATRPLAQYLAYWLNENNN